MTLIRCSVTELLATFRTWSYNCIRSLAYIEVLIIFDDFSRYSVISGVWGRWKKNFRKSGVIFWPATPLYSGHSFPLLYVMLTSKTQQAYVEVLRATSDLAQHRGLQINCTKWVSDYESGVSYNKTSLSLCRKLPRFKNYCKKVQMTYNLSQSWFWMFSLL